MGETHATVVGTGNVFFFFFNVFVFLCKIKGCDFA